MASPPIVDKTNARNAFIAHWFRCKNLVIDVTAAEDDAARKRTLEALQCGLVSFEFPFVMVFLLY